MGKRSDVPPPEPDGPVPPTPNGLTDNATESEVNAWLALIAGGIGTKTGINTRTTPEIAQLAAIPPQQYGVLLAALDRRWEFGMRACLEVAVNRAVRGEHRDLVLAAFPRHPALAEAIVRKGWSEAAASTMRAWLKAGAKPTHYVAYDNIIEALVRVGDENDGELLRNLLVKTHLGDWQAKYLKRLERMPGFDLRSTTRTAWIGSARAYGHDALALPAVQQGIGDAMPIVVACAIGDPSVTWRSETNTAACRTWLAGHFGLTARPAGIAAWWKGAQGQLVWDEATACWHGPPPPPEALVEDVPVDPTPAREPDPPPAASADF